jgi:uncharacterized membrane protein YcaP (DUF421 family)
MREHGIEYFKDVKLAMLELMEILASFRHAKFKTNVSQAQTHPQSLSGKN